MDVKERPVSGPRSYPDHPRVGVGAVVFDPLHRVLLVRRGQPPHQGQWGLPGGMLQLGETLQDGLHRELWEECHIEIEIVDLISVYEPIIRDREDRIVYHYVVLDYLCRWKKGELMPGDDAQAVAWVSPQNMAQYELMPVATQMIAAARSMAARHT